MAKSLRGTRSLEELGVCKVLLYHIGDPLPPKTTVSSLTFTSLHLISSVLVLCLSKCCKRRNVLPIYELWIYFVISVAAATCLIGFFIPVGSLLSTDLPGSIVEALDWALNHFLLEWIGLIFVQSTLGLKAVRRSGKYAFVWSACTFLRAYSYIRTKKSTNLRAMLFL